MGVSVFGLTIDWLQALGYVASGFAAGAMLMKRMIPLRLMVICSNVVFLVYATVRSDMVLLSLHAILLPLNVYRLVQMRQLVGRIEHASSGVISQEWVTTFMRRRKVAAGTTVFRKGDEARELFYIVSGRFLIPEIDVALEPGAMVGEFGLVAPDRARSQSLTCVEAGELLVASYDEIWQLYCENPEFGMFFLRLIASRMRNNMDAMQAELKALRTETERLRSSQPAENS